MTVREGRAVGLPLLFLMSSVVVAGCAPRADLPKAANGPKPAVSSLLHGSWTGRASVSPCGEQPYAITFAPKGADLVGETPPTLDDEPLPAGSYQRFVFAGGPDAPTLDYKTAMGGKGFLEGRLELEKTDSSPTRRRYCEPNACERFELRWESMGPRSLSLQVWMDGKLHADMALEFDGDQ